MKRKVKEQSMRERKEAVIENDKVIWDKPLTNRIALKIINSVKHSHWSIVYDFWYEDAKEGDFGRQTWVDLEAHDMGWVWSSAWDEAKRLGWSHKEYHKEVQRRLYEGVERQLMSIVNVKTLPKWARPSKSWRKEESKNKYRVVRFVGHNSKGLPTAGYYIYRTDVTDVTSDKLIIV